MRKITLVAAAGAAFALRSVGRLGASLSAPQSSPAVRYQQPGYGQNNWLSTSATSVMPG